MNRKDKKQETKKSREMLKQKKRGKMGHSSKDCGLPKNTPV